MTESIEQLAESALKFANFENPYLYDLSKELVSSCIAQAREADKRKIEELEAFDHSWEFSEISNAFLGCRNGTVEQIKGRITELESTVLSLREELVSISKTTVCYGIGCHACGSDTDHELSGAAYVSIKALSTTPDASIRNKIFNEGVEACISAASNVASIHWRTPQEVRDVIIGKLKSIKKEVV